MLRNEFSEKKHENASNSHFYPRYVETKVEIEIIVLANIHRSEYVCQKLLKSDSV